MKDKCRGLPNSSVMGVWQGPEYASGKITDYCVKHDFDSGTLWMSYVGFINNSTVTCYSKWKTKFEKEKQFYF